MDGQSLGYDDLGHGEPALLLLTGWCSSRARWALAAPLLAAHRRVVSFEWRGHGESAPAFEDFGTPEMVQDALTVIEATGLHTFIPCAASHSGWVAIELRRRLGDRIPAIALVDWMVTEPSAPYMELISQLQSSERWPQARDALFEIWRAGVRDDEIGEAIEVMNAHGAGMWMRSGREIERSYRDHHSPLRAFGALDPHVRVLHLYGQPRSAEYLEAQRAFASEHPWFGVQPLSTRTHFSMLEAPTEVATPIERLAADLR